MGKWDRRWIPRRRYNNRKYKDYDYEEPPPSPPPPHHSQSNPPAIQDGSESSWEMDFCKAVRVPWQKVVTAKKYMYCHENVLHWDDSAGEHAFQNAKHTYWEKINGLPSNTPLPDPDMYIDKVDWSPEIDPRLIADLDKEYFNPDDTGRNYKLATRGEKIHDQDPGCGPDNDRNNPWEKGSSHKVDTVKCLSQNWGQYNKPISVMNVSNPWEQSCSLLVESSKSKPWTSHVDPASCWNHEAKNYRQRIDGKSACDTSLNRGCKDSGDFVETGGREDDWSGGWKPWNNSDCDQKISGDNVRWPNNFVSHTGTPWNKVWEGKQLKNNFKGFMGSERAYQPGYRKREGSYQNRQRYKISRFQVDDHGAAYLWQKERSNNPSKFYV